jgi:hypothetical protein
MISHQAFVPRTGPDGYRVEPVQALLTIGATTIGIFSMSFCTI